MDNRELQRVQESPWMALHAGWYYGGGGSGGAAG
jgi:hypothetical protein